MVVFTRGNIFYSQAQALINPVNCMGVMGAGLALQFKQKFPINFTVYAEACKAKQLNPGGLVAFTEKEKVIINLATKDHWRNPSKLQYIKDGLQALVRYTTTHHIESVAIPPLGCGLGGLNYRKDVKPLINDILGGVPSVKFMIYEPSKY